MKIATSLGICTALISGYFALSCQQASANPRVHHRINHRQLKQQGRIGKGVANDSLTKKEAARLQVQQQKLAAREQRMRASGCGLSPKERVKLEKQQDALSNNIYQQKHDEQTRN